MKRPSVVAAQIESRRDDRSRSLVDMVEQICRARFAPESDISGTPRRQRVCHLRVDQFADSVMVYNPVWAICERVAEVQALLHDHIECGKHSAADVVAKAQAVLSEAALLRAMFDVGYFPPNTPPPVE